MPKFRRASGMPDTKASVSSAFPRLNSGLGLDGDLADLALLFGFPLLDDLADLFFLRVMWLVAVPFGRTFGRTCMIEGGACRSGGGAFGRACMTEGGAFPSPTTTQGLSI